MINWENIKFNSPIAICLTEESGECHELVVLLKDYEWTLARKPYIADLYVKESKSPKFQPNDVLRLPLESQEKEGFLIFAPRPCQPNRELKMQAKICLN
jgi:hypothetical protein